MTFRHDEGATPWWSGADHEPDDESEALERLTRRKLKGHGYEEQRQLLQPKKPAVPKVKPPLSKFGALAQDDPTAQPTGKKRGEQPPTTSPPEKQPPATGPAKKVPPPRPTTHPWQKATLPTVEDVKEKGGDAGLWAQLMNSSYSQLLREQGRYHALPEGSVAAVDDKLGALPRLATLVKTWKERRGNRWAPKNWFRRKQATTGRAEALQELAGRIPAERTELEDLRPALEAKEEFETDRGHQVVHFARFRERIAAWKVRHSFTKRRAAVHQLWLGLLKDPAAALYEQNAARLKELTPKDGSQKGLAETAHYLEALDPKHRNFKEVYTLFVKEWLPLQQGAGLGAPKDAKSGPAKDAKGAPGKDAPKGAPEGPPDFFTWLDAWERKNGKTLKKIRYMDTAGAREPYRLRFKGKTVCGSRLDTAKGTWAVGAPVKDRNVLYTMSPAGDFFGLHETPETQKSLHHSSFLAGGPVGSAGTFLLSGGDLLQVTLESGHYAPTVRQMRNAIEKLRDRHGVPLASVWTLPIYKTAFLIPPPVRAADLLRDWDGLSKLAGTVRGLSAEQLEEAARSNPTFARLLSALPSDWDAQARAQQLAEWLAPLRS